MNSDTFTPGALVRVTLHKGRATDRVPFVGTVRLLDGTFGGDLLVVDNEAEGLPIVIARNGVQRTDLTVEAAR